MDLQSLLRALCRCTGWTYALFWKLKHRVLSWEDGYYSECMEKGEQESSCGCLSHQMSLAAATLSSQLYSFGEGIIGIVAFTGKHWWVYSDGEHSSINVEAHLGGSDLHQTFEKMRYPAEWENQFAAGIKTIAVIAVSEGVVQLGSNQMMMEDLNWVDHVRSMFRRFQGVVPQSFPSELVTFLEEEAQPTHRIPKLAMPPFSNSPSEAHVEDNRNLGKGIGYCYSSSSQALEVLQGTEKGEKDIFLYHLRQEEVDTIPIVMEGGVGGLQTKGLSGSIFKKRQSNLIYVADSCLAEAFCDKKDTGIRRGELLGELNNYHLGDVGSSFELPSDHNRSQFQVVDNTDSIIGGSSSSLGRATLSCSCAVETMVGSLQKVTQGSSFVIGDELSQALGPIVFMESSSGKALSEEALVENNQDHPPPPHHPPHRRCRLDGGVGVVGDDELSLCTSVVSELNGGCQKQKGERKRRGSRPRPKDRQQIQDCVRELRDIIPNGSKCSIDSLLEKAIKYMLFLRGVLCHSDLLQQSHDFQIEKRRSASGALEFGGVGVECPIVVENLQQPRQMLVEMVCEESGLFLEIANTVNGLGLTILKGIIETRSGKVWASFIVEAMTDICRVDIVLALMPLLASPFSRVSSNLSRPKYGNASFLRP